LALKFCLQGILFLFFGLLFIQSNAQSLPELKDSVQIKIEKPVKKNIPAKATMYSAVLPGLGQIYNKKYFKVPIIYGGFIGLGYYIAFNNTRYLKFKQAYYDLNDNNPLTKSYETTYPNASWDYTDKSNYDQYNQTFIDNIDYWRRNRDILIISTVGLYLLNILDANVDANFIDFDISEDLTMNFEPIIVDPITNSPILGGHFVFTF
jgi:hypothetical protein